MSGSRVLVVDSDREHAGHCRSFLTQAGFEVTVVPNASLASMAMSQGDFAAVLLDLPCVGDPAPLRARAAEQGASVLAMSDIFVGRTNRDLARAIDGDVELWTKPVRSDVALAVLRTRPGVELSSPPSARSAPRHDDLGRAFVAAAGGRLERPADDPLFPKLPEPAPLEASGDLTAFPKLHDEPFAESGAAKRVALGRSGASPRTSAVEVPPALDTARLGTSGSLADTTFAAVLFRLAADEATGELRVTHDVLRKSVFLDRGRVVGVTSDAPHDRLEVVLRADGVVSSAQLDTIRRRLGPSALESEESYVEVGAVDPEQFEQLRGFLARRRLLDMFGWRSGSWVFTPAPPRGGVRADLDASTLELVWEGVQHGDEQERVRAVLAPYLGRPMAWTGQPPARGDIALTRWQRAIIGSIDGETPAAEVLMGAPDRDAALALVYTLVVAGRVAFRP